MKKIIFFSALFVLNACSTSSKSALNCERLHADSEIRVEELKQVLISYQNINYDLAVKLSPPLKEEVAEMDSRIHKQKMRCWPKEKKPIDSEMALLKEELFKVYGDNDEPKKPKVIASKTSHRKPASRAKDESTDIVESVQLDEAEN